ncbi:phage gp6-like head-tail connector protein [Jiangella alba]|uniref:Head-to-tail adaptor n=1 Tax=Jiangella alba TaxID=561176 RepID=A0A1H5PIZ4_9ACTN|nr:phage gp6-like head-tail connector protein [Jiangella alba]SEF13790.1 hypothetical protein SAMN04488561_4475 [Jiangella alba]
MADWASVEFARQMWADAPESDAVLNALLDAAQIQCEAYAPPVNTPTGTPAYRLATVMQAQDLWQNTEAAGDVLGFDGEFAIRIRPLGADVKALLRPPSARLRVNGGTPS